MFWKHFIKYKHLEPWFLSKIVGRDSFIVAEGYLKLVRLVFVQKVLEFEMGGWTLDVFNIILDIACACQLDLEKISLKPMQGETKL